MWLFALIACGEDACEVDRVEVEDDAHAGDLPYSAAEVLDVISGAHAFTGASDSNRAADVTLELTRGAGSAELTDATLIRRLDRDDLNPLYRNHDLDVSSACFDELSVPVTARVEIPEMRLDVTFEATARPPEHGSSVGITQVWVSGSVPVDTHTLPYPPDGASSAILTAIFDDGALGRFRFAWLTESSASDYEILEMNWYDDT